MEHLLDRCEKALADKPALASIFDGDWRESFREKALGTEKIGYPAAYAAPVFGESLPSDYQSRLEDGAAALLPKLSEKDRSVLTGRLRGKGCVSAEEELLLARSFALEFGNDAVLGPKGDISKTRPEFAVLANGLEIAIEAKGLLDSENIRLNWQGAHFASENFWVSPFDTLDKDLKRVELAIKKKVGHLSAVGCGIIVFTQYTLWPPADITTDLIRNMVLEPSKHGIHDFSAVLSVAFVSFRLIQGVWFNPHTAERCCIEPTLRERLRTALRDSFYPRSDGLFFDETMDEKSHKAMLDKMHDHH